MAAAKTATARENPPATRTAAAAIAASVEILQSHLEFVLDERVGPLSADQRRFLDVAARHGRLLARLSEDLETLALAEVGHLEPEWAPCDLAVIAEEALRQVWPLAAISRKPIELRAAEPVWVVGDAKHIGRATLELLELAVRSAARESTIRLFAAPVALEVSYEGEPPPEEALALCLVRAVATAHGGSFVREEEDGSVRFSLSLVVE
jgi:signal transduction histidine kinase